MVIMMIGVKPNRTGKWDRDQSSEIGDRISETRGRNDIVVTKEPEILLCIPLVSTSSL
jgi:hypothetical protein